MNMIIMMIFIMESIIHLRSDVISWRSRKGEAKGREGGARKSRGGAKERGGKSKERGGENNGGQKDERAESNQGLTSAGTDSQSFYYQVRCLNSSASVVIGPPCFPWQSSGVHMRACVCVWAREVVRCADARVCIWGFERVFVSKS